MIKHNGISASVADVIADCKAHGMDDAATAAYVASCTFARKRYPKGTTRGGQFMPSKDFPLPPSPQTQDDHVVNDINNPSSRRIATDALRDAGREEEARILESGEPAVVINGNVFSTDPDHPRHFYVTFHSSPSLGFLVHVSSNGKSVCAQAGTSVGPLRDLLMKLMEHSRFYLFNPNHRNKTFTLSSSAIKTLGAAMKRFSVPADKIPQHVVGWRMHYRTEDESNMASFRRFNAGLVFGRAFPHGENLPMQEMFSLGFRIHGKHWVAPSYTVLDALRQRMKLPTTQISRSDQAPKLYTTRHHHRDIAHVFGGQEVWDPAMDSGETGTYDMPNHVFRDAAAAYIVSHDSLFPHLTS